ncbi:MAG: DUF2190 family protein [Gammaproteobacteria bacterium]|nr:DUF2190 family protein [Gammaproteobacteria bacterium]NIV51103.1 DUF2190 family protein [Gammaproteobacteria bacterium]NIW23955.1 DUF2190 family protein [Gammaproteobacteria bacterium]NIX85045.1 DUF2190 family protein [Gammaproteobacteria bacterium]
MATAKDLFDISVPAGSDLSSNQYYLVKRSGGNLAVCSTAGERPLGVLQDDPSASGRAGLVRTAGLTKVEAGGTIAQDDLLTVDSSGKAVKATTTGGGYVWGVANEAGSSGEIISALIGMQGVGYTATNGMIQIPMSVWQEQDGTALADFSDGASPTPGYSAGDESFGIRWNNHANPDPISCSVTLPYDVDTSSAITMNILAAKVGATVGDAVTWTVEAFNNVDGALYDADADYGGTSSAMTGDATSKTCQLETLTLAAANLPAAGSQIVLTIQPTDGTLGTDDVILLGVWLQYTRL